MNIPEFKQYIEFNKPLFVSFVDLAKVFVRVRLDGVMKILDQNNIDYQRIIQELNSRSRTKIKTNDKLTEEVQINTDIQQHHYGPNY